MVRDPLMPAPEVWCLATITVEAGAAGRCVPAGASASSSATGPADTFRPAMRAKRTASPPGPVRRELLEIARQASTLSERLEQTGASRASGPDAAATRRP